jgi:hypothetical protein
MPKTKLTFKSCPVCGSSVDTDPSHSDYCAALFAQWDLGEADQAPEQDKEKDKGK